MPKHPLEVFIRNQIEAKGPMHLGHFIEHVLMHPDHGYYTQKDPFGQQGDFTTAPEISQIFGEMIGAWLVDVWQKMQRPEAFTLLECGPGRGTLMRDVLRVAHKLDKGFIAACRPHLLEGSAALKVMQMELLSVYDLPYRWIASLDELPSDQPVLMVANEFFDALPIRQVEKKNGQWKERAVGLVNGALSIMHQPASANLLLHLNTRLPEAQEGDVFEVGPARLDFFRAFLQHLKQVGGAFLVIDYGYLGHAEGVSLQAVHQHRYVDIFDHLGEADLSAHVDFGALLAEIKNHSADMGYGLSEQGHFLHLLGADVRRDILVQAAQSVDQQTAIDQGYQRLVSSDAMGQLFKVLGGVSGYDIALSGF